MKYYMKRTWRSENGKLSVFITEHEGKPCTMFPFTSAIDGALLSLATEEEYRAFRKELESLGRPTTHRRCAFYGPAWVISYNRHNRRRGMKGYFFIF